MSNNNIILHKNDLPESFTLKGKSIAIDTETMGLNLHRDRLCLLQLKDESNTVHLIQFARKNYKAPNLIKILANKEIEKIFHYARFDLTAIYIYLGVLCENIFCTKIASKLVRTYTDRHGLQELVRQLLQIEIKKQHQLSDWGAENLSDDQKNYAATDVLYLHQLKEILTNMLVREDRLALAESCFRFLPAKTILDILGWLDEKDIFQH